MNHSHKDEQGSQESENHAQVAAVNNSLTVRRHFTMPHHNGLPDNFVHMRKFADLDPEHPQNVFNDNAEVS